MGISGKPRKSGRRGSQQRRVRKGGQDHEVRQWQVPGNNRLANYGQPRVTSYHRTEAEKEARWAEHFSEVLDRPPSPTEADI